MNKACVGEADGAAVELFPWLTDGGDFTACYWSFEKGGSREGAKCKWAGSKADRSQQRVCSSGTLGVVLPSLILGQGFVLVPHCCCWCPAPSLQALLRGRARLHLLCLPPSGSP